MFWKQKSHEEIAAVAALSIALVALVGVASGMLPTAFKTEVHAQVITTNYDSQNSSYNTELTPALETAIQASAIRTAVSVIDNHTGQAYNAGAYNQQFKAASTIKTLTAIAYLQLVDQGKATLDQTIGGVPARELLRAMMQDSDNTSWHTLNDYIGASQLQQYATGLGVSSYVGEDMNLLTSEDCARLLELLANNKLLSMQSRELLYSYMGTSNNRELITSSMPAGVTTYNKYGMLFGNLHDSAIVTTDDTSLSIVIYTDNGNVELEDYAQRSDYIRSLASIVASKLATN
ncbi:serine hydrolase [Candidatus Saccharibacteria bacterium]|nr:serine hydrolase [Candidatus Saccharibacteria bacterium]